LQSIERHLSKLQLNDESAGRNPEPQRVKEVIIENLYGITTALIYHTQEMCGTEHSLANSDRAVFIFIFVFNSTSSSVLISSLEYKP
jgi:hypothetical protein